MSDTMRAQDRSRFFYPLFFGVALFAIYWFLLNVRRLIPGLYRFIDDTLAWDIRTVQQIALFVAMVPLVLLVVRALDSAIFDLIISRRKKVSAPPLLRDVSALLLYILLFGLAFTAIFKQPLTGILATGTILAAVLGLALQETLGNLFSGIALHMEDSYEVGDVLRSGDMIGTVEHVSWRATRLRTFNNDIAILPNSIIARERLEVFPRHNLNARVLSLGVDYHVPPARVIEVLAQAASHVDGVARELPCIARVGGFGDSAVTYEIKYFTRDYAARDRIDADIRKAAWYAMRRNGIAIPFPIRSFQPYAPPKDEARDRLERDEIVALLGGIDLLSPLTEAARGTIADAARVHFYSKGEAIINRGAAGDSMFIVHRGTVAVRVRDDGATGGHEVAQLGPGSVFGEMALLTGEQRTADVVAVSDVTAIEVDKAALHSVLRDHPEFATALSAKIAERRDHLESLRSEAGEDVQTTLLSRIRSYFGL